MMLTYEEEVLLSIITKSTNKFSENGIEMIVGLTKRGLEEQIRREKPTFGGRDKMTDILFSLRRKGFASILVNGIACDEDDLKNLHGKKWQIVSSDISDALKDNLLAAKFIISGFEREISYMESIGKFKPEDFMKYYSLKSKVLSFPLRMYFQEEIKDHVIDEIMKQIMPSMKHLLNSLVRIEKKQQDHYLHFNAVISDMDRLGELNVKRTLLEKVHSENAITKKEIRNIDHQLFFLVNTMRGNLNIPDKI